MSLRPLVEADCGRENPLIQLGQRFTRDSAFRDEGFARGPQQPVHPFQSDGLQKEQMMKEFLGQVAGPPQTFRMDNLLEEMRQIEQQNFHQPIIHGPKVIHEVTAAGAGGGLMNELHQNVTKNLFLDNADFMDANQGAIGGQIMQYQRPISNLAPGPMMWNQPNFINVQPMQSNISYAKEFFDEPQEMQEKIKNMFDEDVIEENQVAEDGFSQDWLKDFEKHTADEAEKTESYYEKFWSKLQQDWNELAEYENHPWLSGNDTELDLYKEYEFAENNPMQAGENALDKGKEFLKQGDIPSAVLCFEAAAKQDPQNAEVWELLGISQAENEMDPHAIAALRKCLDLQPNNMKVLMALAVSYTNESLQSQALNMLAKWLYSNPKYQHLMPPHLLTDAQNPSVITSSLIGGAALKDMQSLFMRAVQLNPQEIDPDIQEALGVLFNLSSEYDKAVDCFNAALSVNSSNAKTWNRLGASLANGNRSVEAVEAYKHALRIEPGFIRARYNVGIICMNLKSYKEAAEHLLTALNMQATCPGRSGLPETVNTGTIQMSEVIWSTLKMVFALMGRDDLKQAANKKDLDCLNHEIKLE